MENREKFHRHDDDDSIRIESGSNDIVLGVPVDWNTEALLDVGRRDFRSGERQRAINDAHESSAGRRQVESRVDAEFVKIAHRSSVVWIKHASSSTDHALQLVAAGEKLKRISGSLHQRETKMQHNKNHFQVVLEIVNATRDRIENTLGHSFAPAHEIVHALIHSSPIAVAFDSADRDVRQRLLLRDEDVFKNAQAIEIRDRTHRIHQFGHADSFGIQVTFQIASSTLRHESRLRALNCTINRRGSPAPESIGGDHDSENCFGSQDSLPRSSAILEDAG